MGQRVGDAQQFGARCQLLADAFLQREEQFAHAVELVLQIDGFAGERTAGVHDGEGEIVADVGVDAREGELQRTYPGWWRDWNSGRQQAGGGRPSRTVSTAAR
ncbi:hypothetical protein SHKM778_62230 [Streptomyces sp. KM77-8]|uniref:Uncharacterized protein n=1 Tax=Streptomyces haneummycinicus TaxID=3074435 RepID=A0AAT9HRM3_9ACTN